MQDQINAASFVPAIMQAAAGRFDIDQTSKYGQIMLGFAPPELLDHQILRLRRMTSQDSGWRTVLVSAISSLEKINEMLQWAAEVKNYLLDPESSDLYLMAAINDPDCSLDACTNIEANDQFCRKYILRPGETLDAFMGRTFLGPVSGEAADANIADPLLAALAATGRDHDWFTPAIQSKWQKALLSARSGSDMVELLFILK